mmetsp:Transcript_18504/g.57819  ORF Transcript_18504/g.57819 Transcript_18504/m.57819 type:complete len:133 (-) Transcript_18504:3764-4162(-)
MDCAKTCRKRHCKPCKSRCESSTQAETCLDTNGILDRRCQKAKIQNILSNEPFVCGVCMMRVRKKPPAMLCRCRCCVNIHSKCILRKRSDTKALVFRKAGINKCSTVLDQLCQRVVYMQRAALQTNKTVTQP